MLDVGGDEGSVTLGVCGGLRTPDVARVKSVDRSLPYHKVARPWGGTALTFDFVIGIMWLADGANDAHTKQITNNHVLIVRAEEKRPDVI